MYTNNPLIVLLSVLSVKLTLVVQTDSMYNFPSDEDTG